MSTKKDLFKAEDILQANDNLEKVLKFIEELKLSRREVKELVRAMHLLHWKI